MQPGGVRNHMASGSFMHPPAARHHSCDGSWSRATAMLPEKNQRAESMLPFLFRRGRAAIYKITPSPSNLFARRARWCYAHHLRHDLDARWQLSQAIAFH